jgi:hypothetical protein
LLSEDVFVDVDVTEQQQGVRAMARIVVDQQRMTAQLHRRHRIEFLGIDVVAVAGQKELAVERGESSEAGFVERLRLDLRLGPGEKLVVVFPENRPVRSDGFGSLPMEMMDSMWNRGFASNRSRKSAMGRAGESISFNWRACVVGIVSQYRNVSLSVICEPLTRSVVEVSYAIGNTCIPPGLLDHSYCLSGDNAPEEDGNRDS